MTDQTKKLQDVMDKQIEQQKATLAASSTTSTQGPPPPPPQNLSTGPTVVQSVRGKMVALMSSFNPDIGIQLASATSLAELEKTVADNRTKANLVDVFLPRTSYTRRRSSSGNRSRSSSVPSLSMRRPPLGMRAYDYLPSATRLLLRELLLLLRKGL